MSVTTISSLESCGRSFLGPVLNTGADLLWARDKDSRLEVWGRGDLLLWQNTEETIEAFITSVGNWVQTGVRGGKKSDLPVCSGRQVAEAIVAGLGGRAIKVGESLHVQERILEILTQGTGR